MLRRWGARMVALAAAVTALSSAALLAAAPAHADLARTTEQWVINELNLDAAWAKTQGSGVTVAVIDSGVNPSVSDLVGSVITGPDLSGVHTSPANPNWGVHGTWMASLVAGHGHGTGNGILGSAPAAKVLSIRVIADSLDPNFAKYEAQSSALGQSELAAAITYAVAHKAGVISMSLGYNLQSRLVRAALQDAYDHNVVVVASAGNSGDATGATGTANYSFPADYPGVLAVAAVNRYGKVASFSSENLSVQVAAPGTNVPAQGRDGTYWYVSGTSPACALTAGVAALIRSAYPSLTDAQVISAITSSTTPSTRPPDGWDQQIGFGVVNAGRALTAAGSLAAARAPAVGLAAASHFGGGPAAVPPVPVAPRGPGALIGYFLLALACLGLIALATSRLLAPAQADGLGDPGRAGGSGESGRADGAGESGRPRPRPAASSPVGAEPSRRRPAPPDFQQPTRPMSAPSPQPRHAAPRSHGGSNPDDGGQPPT